MATYYDSLAWKLLATVENGKVFIAVDRHLGRILIRYQNTLDMLSIESIVEFHEYLLGECENIKPGLSEGELIASFTFAE